MKSISFYLEWFQRYSVLKNVQFFWATLYCHQSCKIIHWSHPFTIHRQVLQGGGTALFTLALQWQNHKAMPTEVKMQVQLNHPYLYICPSLEAMAGLDVVAELLVPSEYPLLYRLPDWVASCSWLAAMPIICCPAYCWPPGQTCEK